MQNYSLTQYEDLMAKNLAFSTLHQKVSRENILTAAVSSNIHDSHKEADLYICTIQPWQIGHGITLSRFGVSYVHFKQHSSYPIKAWTKMTTKYWLNHTSHFLPNDICFQVPLTNWDIPTWMIFYVIIIISIHKWPSLKIYSKVTTHRLKENENNTLWNAY